MNIIIDTNVLMSALIKDAHTRRLILESEQQFYYPEIAFIELNKYKKLILEKSGLSESEYKTLFDILMKKIILIKIIKTEFLEEAKKLIGEIDVNDIIFIATSLNIKNSMLWSDDKHLKQQEKVFNTKEITILLW